MMNVQDTLSKLTEEKRTQICGILDDQTTKSGKIRSLYVVGMEVKDIAKLMDIKYNFAYNVVSQLIKEGGTSSQSFNEKSIIAKKKTDWKREIIQKMREILDILSTNILSTN
jgi:transposase